MVHSVETRKTYSVNYSWFTQPHHYGLLLRVLLRKKERMLPLSMPGYLCKMRLEFLEAGGENMA